MYLKSEVVRGQSDGLRQERWMFSMSDRGHVYVSFYTLSERTTRRHGDKMVSHEWFFAPAQVPDMPEFSGK